MTETRAGAAGWIAADWGTTHLRAWAMAPDGAVLDQAPLFQLPLPTTFVHILPD